jgi:hypothetical protein
MMPDQTSIADQTNHRFAASSPVTSQRYCSEHRTLYCGCYVLRDRMVNYGIVMAIVIAVASIAVVTA